MADTLLHKVSELARQCPDKSAVIFKKETLTYAGLYARSCMAGQTLRRMGVREKDRVLFTALSKPETIVTYLGIQQAGGIAVLIDKNSTAQNSAMIYQDTDAVLFLTDKKMGEDANNCRLFSLKQFYSSLSGPVQRPQGSGRAADASEKPGDTEKEGLRSCDPEAIAEILFTTGTTGRPKGVMLSYRAVYNILINTITGTGMQSDDTILMPLPLNHSFPLRVSRAALYSGATLVLQNGFTFANELENNIREYACTALATVPASLELVRGQMRDTFPQVAGRLRYIEVGAGSLTIRQRQLYTQLLPDTKIINTWGSSETGGALFTDVAEAVRHPARISAIGRPVSGVEVKVLGTDGQPVQSDHDHPGRLALCGGMVMSGYWKRPDLTEDVLRDGWLVTADMVYTDEDGYVYMLGRADDIINVGGEKVSPIEIENIAGLYGGIKECACIGVEDPNCVLGQVPALFMAVENGTYSEADLRQYLSSKLERIKIPQAYVIIPELPRNRMKKIDRGELRKIWAQPGREGDTDLNNPAIQNILSRHSVRKFTDRSIPKNWIDVILKCGLHAPTGHNLQTWQFTVVTDRGQIEQLRTSVQEAARKDKVSCSGFNNPACMILVSNDGRNPNGCQDASCAAENMLLAAHSLGLGGVWLNPMRTLRQKEPLKGLLDRFGVPENHTVWSAVAIGFPAEDPEGPARKEKGIHFVSA